MFFNTNDLSSRLLLHIDNTSHLSHLVLMISTFYTAIHFILASQKQLLSNAGVNKRPYTLVLRVKLVHFVQALFVVKDSRMERAMVTD